MEKIPTDVATNQIVPATSCKFVLGENYNVVGRPADGTIVPAPANFRSLFLSSRMGVYVCSKDELLSLRQVIKRKALILFAHSKKVDVESCQCQASR